MRDKNLSLQKFNIQLWRTISSSLEDDKVLRTAVSDSPKWLSDSDFRVILPKDFNSLRSLAIIHWFIPNDYLFWEFHLSLQEENSVSQLNEKQKLELEILNSSKEICEFYLYETERYSGREIFGNILGNELKESLRKLKIKKNIHRKPKRKIRHRGYRDKGSLRPDHLWIERYDSSFNEYQIKLEKKRYLHQKTTTKLLQLLTEKFKLLDKNSSSNMKETL
jgi:hypothetical protein